MLSGRSDEAAHVRAGTSGIAGFGSFEGVAPNRKIPSSAAGSEEQLARKVRKDAMDSRVRQLELKLDEMNRRSAETQRARELEIPVMEVSDNEDPLGLQRDIEDDDSLHNDVSDEYSAILPLSRRATTRSWSLWPNILTARMWVQP